VQGLCVVVVGVVVCVCSGGRSGSVQCAHVNAELYLLLFARKPFPPLG
jgi:hypothetical protein